MGVSQAYDDGLDGNPLDILEEVVAHNDWTYARRTPNELAVEAPGQWCDYNLYFAWSDIHHALHLSCALDLAMPETKKIEVHDLLARVNQDMPFGHFSVWADEGVPMFRHSQFLRGGDQPVELMQDMVDVALGECDRYYPVFQFVAWGNMQVDDAMDAALLDTMGEA